MSSSMRISLVAAMLSIGLPAIAQTATTAKVESGLIEGRIADDVLSFKGIPYAAPPVGKLRWRAPQPAPSWTGIRKAIAFGHDCIQKLAPGIASPPGTAPSEDCLVLNIWRYLGPGDDGKLKPVAVWIHGGAFVSGSSSAAVFDGAGLARQGVVLVSFNYRLGRLGFFSHPALSAANEGPIGNFGLMDQIAALQWIKRNIEVFGGDPSQVTVMGESAGGNSVMALLTTPQAKGLFHKAVVMSGGGRTFLVGGRKLEGGDSDNPSADQVGEAFALGLGIQGHGAAALKALRALPAATVSGDLDLSTVASRPVGLPTYAGGPIIDGSLVIANPEEILRGRAMTGVPLLIGTTLLDLPVIFPPSRDNPLSLFGADIDKARTAYRDVAVHGSGTLYFAIGADMTMQEPARFVAREMTRAGHPVWLYRFAYVARPQRRRVAGAYHASELPFLFDSFDYGKDAVEEDRQMALLFGAYVTSFIKTGDPNPYNLPEWPRYDPARADLMIFTNDDGPTSMPDPWAARLDLVEQVAEARARLAVAARELAGSWQLVQFKAADGQTLRPEIRARYTLAFNSNGHVGLRIDCNRGSGTWRSPASGKLDIGPIALTRAMCPAAPLNERLTKDWPELDGFSRRDGHLFLDLKNGASYELEPIAPPRR